MRESSSKDGFLVVSVNRKGNVKHFLINGAPGRWWVAEAESTPRVFNSIQDLVQYYVRLGPESGLGNPAITDNVMSRSCDGCNAPLKENGQFCQRCGARVRTGPE